MVKMDEGDRAECDEVGEVDMRRDGRLTGMRQERRIYSEHSVDPK